MTEKEKARKIKELEEKRKSIDAEITRLEKKEFFEVGKARFETEEYIDGTWYYLRIGVHFPYSGRKVTHLKWYKFVESQNRQDVVDSLSALIADLQKLYASIQEGE